WLEASLAIAMVSMLHGEHPGVVGHDGLDPVGQAVQDLFEKLGGGTAGLLGRDPSHRLAAEVIDGGEFKVVAGVAQGRQELNIEVEQFSWPLFFVTPRTRTHWMRQAILSEASENALHAAVSETELGSNASRPPAPLTQTQDLLFESRSDAGGRVLGSSTVRLQGRPVAVRRQSVGMSKRIRWISTQEAGCLQC